MRRKSLIVIYFFLYGATEKLYVRGTEQIHGNWDNEPSNELNYAFENSSNKDQLSEKNRRNSVVDTFLRKCKQTIVMATNNTLIKIEQG